MSSSTSQIKKQPLYSTHAYVYRWLAAVAASRHSSSDHPTVYPDKESETTVVAFYGISGYDRHQGLLHENPRHRGKSNQASPQNEERSGEEDDFDGVEDTRSAAVGWLTNGRWKLQVVVVPDSQPLVSGGVHCRYVAGALPSIFVQAASATSFTPPLLVRVS